MGYSGRIMEQALWQSPEAGFGPKRASLPEEIMRQTAERRVRRSDNPSDAVGYFLESARLKLGFQALVLADPTGGVVAASGHDVDPTVAAKAAPRIFRLDEDFPGDEPESYFVEVLPAAGGSYYLMAVGGRSPDSLKRSGTLTGLRRILDI